MPEANFSYHIFLLPFNWGRNSSKKIDSYFSDLVNLKEADKLIDGDKRWDHNVYNKFSHPEDYNEYVYFYPTVRDVLYDHDQTMDVSRTIRHYQFLPAKDDKLTYTIHVKYEKCVGQEEIKVDKHYELEVDYILLNLYRTGIGLFSYHLKNAKNDQQDWPDILTINDFGRRIYPPYFDYSGKKGFSVAAPKSTSLASSIRISSTSNKFPDVVEDFEVKTGLSVDYKSITPSALEQIPNHIKQILPENFTEEFNVRPTLDDRMFVVSSVCDNMSKFKEKVKATDGEKHESDFSTEFFKYIFIDGPSSPGVSNTDFEQDLLKKHIYSRWKDEGTLFGLSRYSLVGYTTWDKILVDTRTMYYKIAELCLLQRTSVIKFSEEVRRIASMDENENRFSAYINDLYKNYIIFINKIYFRDITPQEQGIELYDILREKMRIEKEVTDLDKEINELHTYALLQEEKSNSNRLQLLTILGGLFIVPSFIISFFGINEIHIQHKKWVIPLLFVIAIASLIVSSIAVKGKVIVKQRNYFLGISFKTWIIILSVMLGIMLVLFLFKQDEG